jgi:ribose/xylose/arabinose/galactoside ABC-type transport system permease subunit
VLLLLFNAFFTPGFFSFEVKNGRLYGTLIDIADRASPVMLLAIGMTLVIATGGVDLSVGAVMAISGIVAAHPARGAGAAAGRRDRRGAGRVAAGGVVERAPSSRTCASSRSSRRSS